MHAKLDKTLGRWVTVLGESDDWAGTRGSVTPLPPGRCEVLGYRPWKTSGNFFDLIWSDGGS